MTAKRRAWSMAGVASLALSAAVHAGGRVIVSVGDLPEYAVAGTPFGLSFVVRDMTGRPIDGLEPAIAASSEADSVRAPAVGTGRAGEYEAILIFAGPGRWTIRFDAFDNASEWERSTLSAFAVIAPGSPPPAPLSQATLGERLFEAKGCTLCHNGRDRRFGPYPVRRRYPDANLAGFLADPEATPGSDSESYIVDMPDLGLTPAEIRALVAHIAR